MALDASASARVPSAAVAGPKFENEIKTFCDRLRTDDIADIVTSEVLSGPIRAFGSQADQVVATLKSHLVRHLAINPDLVFVVGSAKSGFSLSPRKFRRLFDHDSDIDIVVVDASLFDQVWLPLVRLDYYGTWAGVLDDGDFDRLRRLRRGVARGHCSPTDLGFARLRAPGDKTLRTLRQTWFSTFASLSKYTPFTRHSAKARLYRTREHVVEYHSQGLEQLKLHIEGTSK